MCSRKLPFLTLLGSGMGFAESYLLSGRIEKEEKGGVNGDWGRGASNQQDVVNSKWEVSVSHVDGTLPVVITCMYVSPETLVSTVELVISIGLLIGGTVRVGSTHCNVENEVTETAECAPVDCLAGTSRLITWTTTKTPTLHV